MLEEEEELSQILLRIESKSVSPKELDEIFHRVGWSSFSISLKLARCARSSQLLLAKLGRSHWEVIVCAVLKNPNCPASTLRYWAEWGDRRKVNHLIQNLACPSEILVSLCGGRFKEDNILIKEIRRHPNYPEDLVAWAIEVEEW